jgi:hypothetical protein
MKTQTLNNENETIKSFNDSQKLEFGTSNQDYQNEIFKLQ